MRNECLNYAQSIQEAHNQIAARFDKIVKKAHFKLDDWSGKAAELFKVKVELFEFCQLETQKATLTKHARTFIMLSPM